MFEREAVDVITSTRPITIGFCVGEVGVSRLHHVYAWALT